MKQLQSPNLLRTTVFSVLLASVMGVSACSSEKEDTNAQSGDTTGVNQSGESDASLQSGAPLPENDSNIGAGEGSGSAAGTSTAGTSANDGMNTADSSGSTDTSGNSMSDNNTNNDTDENPNLDQTSADGVQ